MSDQPLSGGDCLFLAFLATGPASAYDIKKEMASSVNFFWSAQHSQVYQQAARLQRDGYIEQRGTGPRNRRVLALSDKGRATLRQWLASPAPTYRIYDESLAKLFFAGLTDGEDVHDLLRDQRRQHAELLDEFERLRHALESVDYQGAIPHQLYTLRLGLEVEHAYLRWIDATLADMARRRRSQARRSRRVALEKDPRG